MTTSTAVETSDVIRSLALSALTSSGAKARWCGAAARRKVVATRGWRVLPPTRRSSCCATSVVLLLLVCGGHCVRGIVFVLFLLLLVGCSVLLSVHDGDGRFARPFPRRRQFEIVDRLDQFINVLASANATADLRIRCAHSSFELCKAPGVTGGLVDADQATRKGREILVGQESSLMQRLLRLALEIKQAGQRFPGDVH